MCKPQDSSDDKEAELAMSTVKMEKDLSKRNEDDDSFFTFLKMFRRKHKHWPNIKIAKEGARLWASMDSVNRDKFQRMAKTVVPKEGQTKPEQDNCPPGRPPSCPPKKKRKPCKKKRKRRCCCNRKRKKKCARRKPKCKRKKRKRSCCCGRKRKRRSSCKRKKKRCKRRKTSCGSASSGSSVNSTAST
ncbi:uncharacterized protein LOC108732599 [Agrilus planipennis]|uniref:Uncharacterized protein LOC108732599 n=1 Tax=Agrilus planipennis TaxID=224129 RepID=A0A1W4WG46_AGRPL|nr:uncharacterized protein LOC108732599 [Agrilus planipennis]